MAEDTVSEVPKKSGCSPIMFLIALIILAGVVFGGNEGLGWYGFECGDLNPIECFEEIMSEEESTEGTVAATGPYSYKDNSITMTASIPLAGGAVTGNVTGDCGGKVTGNFDGKDNGVISGKIAGTCSILFVNVPASATFAGVVNKNSKTVPITFEGSGGGFSHTDSFILTY